MMRPEKGLFDFDYSSKPQFFKVIVDCLREYRLVLDLLKCSGQLRGTLSLDREKKSSRAV